MKDYIEILGQIGTKTTYNKGNILFYEGDKPKKLYLLLDGVLRLYKIDSFGNEITLHSLKPTSFVAEMPCFEGLNYPASAVFERDGMVLSVDFERFKKELLTNQELNLTFIASLMQKIRILEHRITQNMLLRLKPRLANFILDSRQTLPNLTQRQIAISLNVTPQSLSRTLRELKDEKVIDIQKGKIQILDAKALYALREA